MSYTKQAPILDSETNLDIVPNHFKSQIKKMVNRKQLAILKQSVNTRARSGIADEKFGSLD